MLAMFVHGFICEQFPLWSLRSWSYMGCCGVAPWLVLVPPHAPPDDTSDRFSFRVKGGLAIELCFRVRLNDGLGSFLGWPIFIFSPSPLGSA